MAIAGVPPFSGFFSKDAILLAAYQHSPWMYWIGVFTAGMTAFYVFRAMFMTFFGSYRGQRASARIARCDVGAAGGAGRAVAGGRVALPDSRVPEGHVPRVRRGREPHADVHLGRRRASPASRWRT